MKLTSVMLARYVDIDPRNLVNIVGGGIRVLHMHSFPASMAFHVLAVVDADPTEQLQVDFQFRFCDADGRPISVSQVLPLVRPGPRGIAIARYADFFHFVEPGDYRIEVIVNGAVLGGVSISAELATTANPAINT